MSPSLELDTMLSCNDKASDSLSRFTFTSDMELLVRKAIADLDGWLAKDLLMTWRSFHMFELQWNN